MITLHRRLSLWAQQPPAPPVRDDTYQVTEFERPDLPIYTARYGTLAYERWLEMESVRWMEQNLRDSWVQRNSEGLVALFSWRKYTAPVVGDDPKV